MSALQAHPDHETVWKFVRGLREARAGVRGMEPGREASLVLTKLDEAEQWFQAIPAIRKDMPTLTELHVLGEEMGESPNPPLDEVRRGEGA